MNYGKKLLHTIMAAVGMVICITGICYKTGYFTGHSDVAAFALIIIGAFITVFGLVKLKND